MKYKWDVRYSEPGFAYGTAANDFLVSSIRYLKSGGSVLCLAEGEGRNSVFLAEQNYQVTAVDNSSVGLEKARNLAETRGVSITTHLADLDDYFIPADSYDGIVSIFCHVPRKIRRKVHKQIFAGLKKGGYFILEAFTPRQLAHGTGGPPDVELLMELDEITKEIEPLTLIHAKEVEREIQEGSYHNGMSAVIQLIACK